MIVGWRCAVCGSTVDVATPFPFRCPRSSPADRHHVLHPLDLGEVTPPRDDDNPFVAYAPRLAWWAFARANGMTEQACEALTREVAAGFFVTPFARSAPLTAELAGEMWIKDETGNVGGSHKGRHLVAVLLHLLAAEALRLGTRRRQPLAIASCGNAAIAAATLAARVDWPLVVFVPEWADDRVVAQLEHLGATVERCPRRSSDPPGDPAMLRFRRSVDAGAVPFSVQGPENALCLDGGRTLGWELADAGVALDRVLVQVGGGALAACVGWGLGSSVRLDAVQAAGCAPLAGAWARAGDLAPDDVPGRWAELMTPWPDPHSAADGILDNEAYDWLAVFDVLHRSGGQPIVVPESAIEAAHAAARRAGFAVSATGAAGLAALLTNVERPAGRTAVLFTGADRFGSALTATDGAEIHREAPQGGQHRDR